MEDRIYISELLDIYGSLLTEKQIDIMELYYNDDLSLAEISEITNTSRQANFDMIKRCVKILYDYEGKMHLLSDKNHLKEMKKQLIDKLDLVRKRENNKSVIEIINLIKNEINDLI